MNRSNLRVNSFIKHILMLLATDLDGTFLGGKSADKQYLYRLIRENEAIRLVFVTGRGLETVIPLLKDAIIPNPEYIICDVGATIVNGTTLQPIQPLQADIENKWAGGITLSKALENFPGIRPQEVPMMRRRSYFFDEDVDFDALKEIGDEFNCDMLVSAGKFVDFLPRGVNKGSTLKQLVASIDVQEEHVLVAGDTLNDLSLFQTGYKGVVVGGSEKSLVDATRSKQHIFQAGKTGCGGIVEAIRSFGFVHPKMLEEEKNIYKKATGENQLLMVYHRLPYEIKEIDGQRKRIPPVSPNGIIPSLMGFFRNGRAGTWVAWEEVDKPSVALSNIYIDEKTYPNLLAARVGLTKKDVDMFYRVFSKEAFWPIIFSFTDKVTFNHDHWNHFLQINKIFAEKTAKEADHGATVWIHDYNLWMVPGFLRQLRPDLIIAFFHHTSFPQADIFNIIPWRGEIIGSLLQCDYIGFHIPRYAVNFVDVVKSIMPTKILEETNTTNRFLSYSAPLGVEKMPSVIEAGSRNIRLGAHPIGVNAAYLEEIYNSEKTIKLENTLRKSIGEEKKIILSVERLDYVKGPLEKIYAFQAFLETHPEYHGKVEMINICTPAAKGMKIYDKVQQELEQAIGRINGKFSSIGWTPIHYLFRSFPLDELVAYYSVSDIAWITPLRDGLNLVAKEYIAIQGLKPNNKGVLIVSEFAGISVELNYALRTNPYDKKSLVDVLKQSLEMEESDRELRMSRMFEKVRHYDLEYWSRDFLEAIGGEKEAEMTV